MNPPFDVMASLTIQRGLPVNCSGAFTYTHFQSLIPKLIFLVKTVQIHVEIKFSLFFFPHRVAAAPAVLTGDTGAGSGVDPV